MKQQICSALEMVRNLMIKKDDAAEDDASDADTAKEDTADTAKDAEQSAGTKTVMIQEDRSVQAVRIIKEWRVHFCAPSFLTVQEKFFRRKAYVYISAY